MPEEMVFCGTASFKDVDKGEPMSGGGKQAQRKEKKKPVTGKKENPYASRGLDKFSMVLAELESRREKVLRRVDGGDHVMVRFVQSETKGWVPIVVKLPTEEPAAKAEPKKKCKSKLAVSSTPPPTQPPSPRTESTSPRGGDDAVKHAAAVTAPAVAAAPTKKKASAAGRWSWADKAIRPSQYWPFVAVLLLLSLVVFGRMFAICCTSIWWYLVPILNGEDGGPRSMGKTGRHLGKKASDKKIGEKITWASLPPSHGKKGSSGDHEVISPRGSHGKKSSSGDHEVISPRRSRGKKSSSSGDHDVISPRSHAHGKKG
ncbi:hypothetical protein CFC21_022693 [Triticum aestivum]|uniref:ZCF37 n=2 Tax=Triticum aestivum TaxID=4565 RepID=A0A3B6C359_WHEAT|nr:uncharacterized protein LOC123041074 [Triticum aestivum]KAF7007792.1 hypothetical protein CFC21_022693 [Triticum aestivum]